MKTTETIENIEIYRVESSDRYISVTRKRGNIVNINYMQGCHEEELQLFKDNYLANDKELTDFILPKINWNRQCEIEEIDRLIWKKIQLEQLKLDTIEKIQSQINEIIQDNCKSGDITPQQTIEMEKLTDDLSELVTEVVMQNI